MLTPEQLNKLSDPVVRIYSNIENDLLMQIINRLKTGLPKSKSEVPAWQIRKLAQMGDLNAEVIRLIAMRSRITVAALRQIIADAGLGNIKTLDVALNKIAKDGHIKSAPPLEQDTAVYDTLRIYQERAVDTANLVNSGLLTGASQVYRDIIAQASANVLTGAQTAQNAVAMTAAQWSAKGIPALIDKGGRHWTVEAYSRMVVNTAANNAANDMQFKRMDSYELDLIEVTSHVGARPLCAPYQGRIFSRNGETKGYTPLSETSYGKPAGLFGINCHHMSYPYVPGVSVQTYFPYPAAENRRAYEASQQQRRLEVAIRKAKTAANAASAIGATDDVTQKLNKQVRDAQSNMRDFIKATGRTRRRDREQILVK